MGEPVEERGGGPLCGLTRQQAEAARRTFGWNELPRGRRTGPLKVFLRQFSNFLVLILIAAGIIAFTLGEYADTLAIGLVIGLNGILGFVQEWRAETALESLRSMLSPQALAVRDGREQVIEARELVPGDLIILEAGARVPADAHLEEAAGLRLDESALTGESVPVDKAPGTDAAEVFAGTVVAAGRALAVVTATGARTAFGEIAALTGAVGLKKTNLQVQLGRLARQLGFAALAIASAILALGLYMGRDAAEMFMTGLSLSVAMVPEGLPAVVTITLALGAAAMVRQKALARRLQAVETLGAASVICTDKTGTLTENKMTVTRVWTLDRSYQVTGTGYDPAGHIAWEGAVTGAREDAVLAELLEAGLTCTHASLHREGGHWQMTGAPTEGALVTLGYKGWAELPPPDAVAAEIPFSSERKRMSVLVRGSSGEKVLTKGAPEQVLGICTEVLTQDGPRKLGAEEAAAITEAYEAMAAEGLRVIGLAAGAAQGGEIREQDMTFLGLAGLIDPPRPEVRAAIGAARSAGIRVIMITGDSPLTAEAIAAQLGLPAGKTLTGDALEALEDAELDQLLQQDVLFARTRPAHKMRIVSALQGQHQIVAMTGDGVNDAPALKQADIGVSMGVRGTDVAKDASDLVLLDDNFATIVRAIGEGRRQFTNVRKFVRYLLSSNAGEVIALLINILIGGPLIFLATQILWMNLVTDGVTAVALGLEKGEPDQMEHPPRRKDTPIVGQGGLLTILALGLYTGLASLWLFLHLLDGNEDLARTAAFTAMVVFEKASVFAFRSLHLPCWRIGFFSNPLLLAALAVTIGAQAAAVYWPPLQVLLHTVPLQAEHWGLIALLVLPILLVPEALKTLRYLAGRRRQGRAAVAA
ncbi:cation-transporting P-type ATPase [Leisingera aquaemixtae]|uniref:cation-translocating P-type ATPase n=1 Tax=Leisingera aquaemixtae TaxID=1396826 RepID=UPI001C9379EB|nr:cation-transporting P-type ATPase [Leisingera aquaemixtae]MBY6069617.1 cation-transporting P-type ATPase [Leisingera aquaemixtae]